MSAPPLAVFPSASASSSPAPGDSPPQSGDAPFPTGPAVEGLWNFVLQRWLA